MANIALLSRLLNGVQRQVNLSQNVIEVGGMQLDGTVSGNLNMTANATTTSYSIIWPAAQSSGTTFLQNDGAGNLSWTAAAATGANTALSNLTTTSINQSLVPASAGTLNLGSNTDQWNSIWANSVLFPSGTDLNLQTGKFYNGNGNYAIDLTNELLLDNSQFTSINWTSRELIDSSGSAIQLSWSTSGVEFNQLTASTVPYLNSSKVLTSSAVTPTQLGYLSGASGTTGTGNLVFSASPTFTGTLSAAASSFSGTMNMNSNSITGLSSPVNPSDAATKSYVDSLQNGTSWKEAVQAATATTLPAYTWASGAGGADTLTGTSNAALIVDGYTVAVNDRILVKNETSTNEPYNGIYVVTATGSVSTPYVLTRAIDMRTWVQIPASATFAQQGTVNADIGFVCTAQPGGTLDTTNITFVQFSSAGAYSADGTTLQLVSGVFSIKNGGVTETQINSSALSTTGALAGGSGTKLSVKVDSSTIDINGGDNLEVKSGGITETQINSSALSATGALAGGSGTKLSVKVDGSSIDINGSDQLEIKAAGVSASKLGAVTDGVTLDQSGAGSTLEVKNAGISATQLSAGAFDQSTITGGAGTAASVAYSPAIKFSGVAGQTFSANTTYAVRFGLPQNSETAGRLYAADITTSSFDLFWVVGFIQSGTSISAGNSVTVIQVGSVTLLSSDTNFGANDPGKAIFLQSGGTNASTTAPSTTGQAVAKLGIATSTTSFFAQIGAPYVY